jgi:hypothetical protein
VKVLFVFVWGFLTTPPGDMGTFSSLGGMGPSKVDKGQEISSGELLDSAFSMAVGDSWKGGMAPTLDRRG